MSTTRSKADSTARAGRCGAAGSALASKNAPAAPAARPRKPKADDLGSADQHADQLANTLRLIDEARAGSQAARADVAQGARAGMRELWSRYATPQERSVGELSDRQVDELIAVYPLELRERLGAALNEVIHLAENEGQSANNLLLNLYRATRDMTSADTLPVSLQLWVALDRLDRAYQRQEHFKHRPQDFTSRKLFSIHQGQVRSGGNKAGTHPSIYDHDEICAEARRRGYFALTKRDPSKARIRGEIIRKLEIIEYLQQLGRDVVIGNVDRQVERILKDHEGTPKQR